ncbi:MAG: hypothetical protein HKN20_14770 [Gemmatimonadetes bacterium]|nr:hypothetical protein [Gemmatimonadota bacterium]
MMKRIAFGMLLAATLSFAGTAHAQGKPKRQIVDLKKLEIDGKVSNPSTMFIRERNGGALYELFPLKRELSSGWLLPVMKMNHDRQTVAIADQS